MEIIAYIHNGFEDKFGIPRQSGRADNLSTIVFEPKFRDPSALRCIDGFSHLWLIFDFSLSHRDVWSPTVRPPRLGGNRRVGVFASRSPFRPNNIGLSSVKLESVEKTKDYGLVLVVSGADLLNMTPIYDIKPYLPFTDCHPDASSGYAGEFVTHALAVLDPLGLLSALPEDDRKTVCDCLENDPKPSYINDDRIFKMRYSEYDISFTCKDGVITLKDIEKL